MKNFMLFLAVVAVVGGLLFWRDVWAIFAGMSVIEALSMIVQFLLHIAVVTIIGFLVTTIPAMIKPWMGLARLKRKQARRQRVQPDQAHERTRMPKMNKDQMITALLAQTLQQKTVKGARAVPDDTTIHFDF